MSRKAIAPVRRQVLISENRLHPDSPVYQGYAPLERLVKAFNLTNPNPQRIGPSAEVTPSGKDLRVWGLG